MPKKNEVKKDESLSRKLKSAKPLSKISDKNSKPERASTPKGKSKLQIKDKPNTHKNDLLNKTAKHPDKKQSKIKKENKENKEKEHKEREEKIKKEKEEKQKIMDEKKKEKEEKMKEDKKKRDEEAKKRKEEKEKKEKE